MIKKLCLFVLCLMLVLPGLAYADETTEYPSSLEKPAGCSVRLGVSEHGEDLPFLVRMTQPNSIMKMVKEENYNIFFELDWKVNDGSWKFNKSWDKKQDQSMWDYYDEVFGVFYVCDYLGNIIHDERNSFDFYLDNNWLKEIGTYDLDNNTYYYRFRYVLEYDDGNGFSHIVSPWSDTASIGKLSAGNIPSSLEAPKNLKAELKEDQNGRPYFHFTCEIPKSVEEVNKQTRVKNFIDWKVGSGKWASESGAGVFEKGDDILFDNVDIDPVDEGRWFEVDIKENIYYFRMYFEVKKPDNTPIRSSFSNIVEIGTPAFYSGASTWATLELNKAFEYGLIPGILVGADMTKPITREEFAEVAIFLYEKASGVTASKAAVNPFTDTANPQILKAFEVGITAGTSPTTFSPNVLINREQCATMLFRTIKAIAPGVDYSISGVADFPDQKYISDWAVGGTKYMSRLGIIKGDSSGNFMPKAATTAQEAAVLMSVRTYDVINK